MIIQMVIGAACAVVLVALASGTRRRGVKLAWWKWVLTVLCVVYAVFVAEVIVGFLSEGSTQAAAVMGLATGIPAVVWGVLLARFVFRRAPHGDELQQATAE